MTTMNKKGLRQLFDQERLLHFSNLQAMQCMKVKLGTHVYFSISVTTINKKRPQALFPITTSSLFKLANHAMHEVKFGMHAYFSISMTTMNKMASGIFDQERLLHFSNLQAMKCIEVKLCRRVHFSVTMTTWAPSLFTSQTCKLYSARR